MKRILLLLILIVWMPLMANNIEAYVYPFEHDTNKMVGLMIKDWKKKIGNKENRRVVFLVEGFQSKEKIKTGPNFELINGEAVRGLYEWIFKNYPKSVYGGDDLSAGGRDFELLTQKRLNCNEIVEFLQITAKRGQKMIDTMEDFYIKALDQKEDYIIIGFMGKSHFSSTKLENPLIKIIWLTQFEVDPILVFFNNNCVKK